MKEYIYGFDISQDRLNSFILKQDFPEVSYMLLEKITEIRFDFFGKDTDFSLWTQGRIFDRKRELKWRALGNICSKCCIYRVVLISQQEDVPECNYREELPSAEEDRCFYLWGIEAVSKNRLLHGNFEPNHFIERSVPRVLSYPITHHPEKNSRVVLLVRPYNDAAGNLRYYRFLGLETEDDR